MAVSPFRVVLTLVASSVLTVAGVVAQNVLPQLNMSETEAQQTALSSITDGYVPYGGAAGRAIKALPATARGPVVEGAIAWARAYVSSPAFASAYAAQRERLKPQPPEVTGSVDDELEREVARQRESIEETRKNVAAMPADMQAEMRSVIEQMEAMVKDPEMLEIMRMGIEGNRASAQSSYEASLSKWEADYPANPNVLVAARLRTFLDVTKDVDFAAATVARNGKQVFADARYESKPSEWKLCYRVGQEATTAARAAATAWLAALGTP